MRSALLLQRRGRRACCGLPLALLLLVAAAGSGRGEERAKSEPSGEEPGAVEVRFTDGGVLKVTLLEDKIEIATTAGTKAVRLADLRKVELSPRLSEADVKRIEAAVHSLGSRNFKEREHASAYLLRRGLAAYPALLTGTKVADVETRRRAEAIIDTLKESLPEDLFEIRTTDLLHTAQGKVSGKIVQESWQASTTQFGPVRVKLADVARALSLAHPEPVAEKLVVQGDPGSLTGLQGQIGKVFAFRVTGLANGQGHVWGTGIYTSDSTLAVAAVHAGVVKVGQTKVVKVRIVAGQNAYVGSTQNGVTSSQYGPLGWLV